MQDESVAKAFGANRIANWPMQAKQIHHTYLPLVLPSVDNEACIVVEALVHAIAAL